LNFYTEKKNLPQNVLISILKKINIARYQWLTAVILATWEAEIRRILV
jgi:hypothetical protein